MGEDTKDAFFLKAYLLGEKEAIRITCWKFITIIDLKKCQGFPLSGTTSTKRTVSERISWSQVPSDGHHC
ncbi:hypothetical protein AV530_007757 [Patagioenas fasciata monilis]|uniref:Uncharacterized protein n=1 Tax=Patagioenas fasciata monilis TaxID=372326 RepID=A0A1V4JZ62_PATFA|nr:hypothetical protein AV530_007757 [Patagioenas fasciata monilis]